MSMNQKEAVFACVTNILSEAGVEGVPAQVINKAQLEQVYGLLCEGFKNGDITFQDTPSNREKLANPDKLHNYVTGLVNNWLRKDTRLNGGTPYVAKNPGSRAGTGDAQLKALRLLMTQHKGTANEARIQAAIDKRIAELKPTVEIDVNALPEDLQDLAE